MKVAVRITGIAAVAWLLDSLSKQLVVSRLSASPPPHGCIVVPDLLCFVLGENHGGSMGIPHEFMVACLVLPSLIMLAAAIWTGWNLREDKPISIAMEWGLGLFVGGGMANWSERVLHRQVTDFIFTPFVPYIFNVADIWITIGCLLVLVEYGRRSVQRFAQQTSAASRNEH